MIDKSFVEKISSMSAPEISEHYGVNYSDKQLFKIERPKASAIEANTLQAVVDYINKLSEGGVEFVVLVAGPGKVEVVSKLDSHLRDRERFLVATCPYMPFRFEAYHDVEEFIIALQSQFVACDNSRAILKMVGNMVTRADVGSIDDGVTQVTEVKTGLADVKKVAVPNPVSLSPFRSFPEIQQPRSSFVLRLKKDQRCALFEADGGTWKIEAIERIANWLRDNIDNKDIPVIA